MNNEEKRTHKRYSGNALGEIILPKDVVEGIVTDISFGGFYIKDEQFSSDYLGEEVDIKITAKLNSNSYSLEGRSRIVRCDDDGMGLFFIGMGNEDITVLGKLILNLSLQESEVSFND